MTDLKKYTNNEKRKKFFEERNESEGWYLWFEEPQYITELGNRGIQETAEG